MPHLKTKRDEVADLNHDHGKNPSKKDMELAQSSSWIKWSEWSHN